MLLFQLSDTTSAIICYIGKRTWFFVFSFSFLHDVSNAKLAKIRQRDLHLALIYSAIIALYLRQIASLANVWTVNNICGRPELLCEILDDLQLSKIVG